MTATLDEIRADIVARRDKADVAIRDAQLAWNTAEAELIAHDRAVALFAPATPPGRRNIADLVLARLTEEPQTVAQLARAVGADAGQVTKALARLSADGKATLYDNIGDEPPRWVRVSGLELGDPR